MNKWYRPFGWLFLASFMANAGGCTSTSGWLAKNPFKKSSDEQVASKDKDKKSKDKKTAGKSKTGSGKSDLDDSSPEALIAKKNSKSKTIDAEHEKFASTDKKKKAATTVADKKSADKKSTDKKGISEAVAKNDVKAASTAPKTKSKDVSPKSEDDLYSYVEKKDRETAEAVSKQKLAAGKTTVAVAADVDPFEEDLAPADKSVVQVKKEVAKSEVDEDMADWAVSSTTSKANAKKAAKPDEKAPKKDDIAENFEKELESPFIAAKSKETPKSQRDHADEEVAIKPAAAAADNDWDEEPAEHSVKSASKAVIAGNAPAKGAASLCPGAEGELRELLSGIEPSDPESLKQGIYRIGQLGPRGSAAGPFLNKMLKHEDPFVRAQAALATIRLNISTPETNVVVTTSLKSRDASLRSFCRGVLEEMSPENKSEVLSSLAQSLNDRDGQSRIRAAEVLIRDEDWCNQAHLALIKCLQDKDENIRWLTAYSLAELAPETPEAVQALIKAAHDPVPRVQVGAVYALGEIGPEAKRATAELKKVAEESSDDELKAAIKYAIEQIEAKSK